ncbi:MCR_0457 family protein [Psychrobacter urativorans]|uniref:MCR_0457 family protein n=1 Tax=Psychrobacter urativorans TaxID=45610 RepID=UPI003BB74202
MNNQSILAVISPAKNIMINAATKVGVAGLMTSMALLSSAAFAAPSTTIPLDMSGMNITKHEIAVMQVLSEICPPMLSGNQKQRFYKSYNVQLHELMPSLEDPKAAIQYLSTQQDYRQILQSIRSWTMSFSKQDNKSICEDLANAEY